VSDEGPTSHSTPFRYNLELTPAQLKITHTALRSLLDDFGHEESDVRSVIQEVLRKLPDERAMRAVRLEDELEQELHGRRAGRAGPEGQDPPPAAA
jgi:hypothetical protein